MPSKPLPTLRSRLTILYIASTSVVFLLLSSLFGLLLWIALHNQIDHHIHIVTTQAEQIINNFDETQEELLLNNLVKMEGMSIVVISFDNSVLMQKNSADISPLNQAEVKEVLDASSKLGHHPLHFSIHGQRFGSATVTVNGTKALLAVGYSTKILTNTYNQMIGIVLGVITLTLIPLAFLGHRLLKKYLNPLEVIADTTQQITHPRKLSSRVTSLPLTQEVSTIVTSLNEMLSRLENIFTSEHEFFSDAAHTLKTPLAALRSKVEGLTQVSEAKRQEIIEIIDGAVDTVQDLLFISRIESGTIGTASKVNLTTIANELCELAEILSQDKKVRVTQHIENNIIFKADQRLIKRAFGNLVQNAVNYVNEEGIISLTLKEENKYIVFIVTNTGEGIQKEELQHVFERFYRGSNAYKDNNGSGLGLAISKAVTEVYKGKIDIKSDSLGKVTVTIVLPIS